MCVCVFIVFQPPFNSIPFTSTFLHLFFPLYFPLLFPPSLSFGSENPAPLAYSFSPFLLPSHKRTASPAMPNRHAFITSLTRSSFFFSSTSLFLTLFCFFVDRLLFSVTNTSHKGLKRIQWPRRSRLLCPSTRPLGCPPTGHPPLPCLPFSTYHTPTQTIVNLLPPPLQTKDDVSIPATRQQRRLLALGRDQWAAAGREAADHSAPQPVACSGVF